MTDKHEAHLHSWVAIAVASTVSLVSLTSSYDDNLDWSREQQWAVSATAISLILAAFAFLLRFIKKEVFAGTHYEHGTVLIVLIFWCAGLPNILNPDSNLAINQFYMVVNANLFFSSWLAFIVAMKMFVDIFPTLVMGDRASTFNAHWVYFGTASLIAMSNASRFWKEFCDSTDEKVCGRSVFGIVLGALGGLFAVIFTVFQHELIEQIWSLLFLGAWCFAVGYLTFNDGPALLVGTYYFSVWTSFLFALRMGTTALTAIYSRLMGDDESNDAAPNDAGATPEGGKVAEETDKHDEEEQEKEDTST